MMGSKSVSTKSQPETAIGLRKPPPDSSNFTPPLPNPPKPMNGRKQHQGIK
jgi:hypothetical protein